MTSFDVRAELTTGPLYFFDQVGQTYIFLILMQKKEPVIYSLNVFLQPSRRNQTKGTRSHMLHFNAINEVPHPEDAIQR